MPKTDVGPSDAGHVLLVRAAVQSAKDPSMLESLRHDVRDAVRTLRKQPAFAFVVAITLGFGIAANTAIFSVVNSVLLRPLTYDKSRQLYVIHEIIPQWAKSYPVLDADLPDFQIWQKESQSFDGIAISESTSMIFAGTEEVEQVRGTRSSANFLRMLGAEPALGRLFLLEEDDPGHGKVVILTDSFWHSRLNADFGIVGRSITLDGAPYTVVGVLPKSFYLPGGLNGFSSKAQFFIPLDGPKFYERDLIGEFDFTAVGKLKPSVSPMQAVAELNVIQARIARQSERENIELRASLFPLQSEIVGSSQRGLILLLAAVGAVLLMICVNVANLLFSRIPGRLRDAAIRKALG